MKLNRLVLPCLMASLAAGQDPASTATSKYGAMRASSGHPQPYGVKQWELGNEVFGDWVRGHGCTGEGRRQ